MKRRILSMLLVICMLITMLPAIALSASTVTTTASDIPKAESADFISRSDGIWLWPLSQGNTQLNDWAGCQGNTICPFHGTAITCAIASHGWYPSGHTGIDIGANIGTDVYAAADGIVYCTGTDISSRGIITIVEHPLGDGWSYYSLYQHLSAAYTHLNGQSVKSGDVIAKSGNTDGGSYTTGAHLHFSIYLAKSGQGAYFASSPNAADSLYGLECKSWLLTEGRAEGKIVTNPAKNCPMGSFSYYPDGGATQLSFSKHHGSVMYTYNKSQVSIGNTLSCSHSYSVSETPAICTATGTKTYTCGACGDSYSETVPALGHSHTGVVTKPTCVSLGYTTYTCSRCPDSYVESSETVWSDWSTTYPDSIDGSLIETQTQYRHRDREQNWAETESGTVLYVPSWPSGFNTSHGLYAQYNKTPKIASETNSQKITVNSDNVIGYIYYHWCRGTYTAGPINRLVGKVCNGEFVTFHTFYSNQGADHYDGNIGYGTEEFFFSNADCCRDSYWYHQIPVREQRYTIEEKQFDGERWSDWSEWSDTVCSASDNREVETRTVYRYPISGLADHSWDDGTVTKKPTATSTGVRTYSCTVCNETKTETIPTSDNNKPIPPATDNALIDMKLYIPVVEQEITDVLSMYNDIDILNSIAYGQLCDIDNDGVQELLISSQYLFSSGENHDILYPHYQQNVYSLYDIVDDRVQTVAWKEPIIAADTGDFWGYAGIVLYKGNPVVMTVKIDDGNRPEDAIYEIANSEVTLYDSKNHAPFHTIKISTTDTDIHYFIDGQAVTQDALKQEMSEYTYLELAEDYYLEYTNSKMTLPELLIYLGGNMPISNPFVDVPGDAFYHDPVLWAVDNTITNGIDATHFGPDAGCTRAHVVTFLWRAAGSPAPSSSYNPFTDVLPGAYYYDAVLWAVEKGITNGTSATTFAPDQTCTRGQIVTFLWRYQHSPSAPGMTSFNDVPAGQYYSTAVAWAVANSITNGMGEGLFAPDATCTRGQIVTFLYRAMV